MRTINFFNNNNNNDNNNNHNDNDDDGDDDDNDDDDDDDDDDNYSDNDNDDDDNGICSGVSTEWLFIHCFQIELEFGSVEVFRSVYIQCDIPQSDLSNKRDS